MTEQMVKWQQGCIMITLAFIIMNFMVCICNKSDHLLIGFIKLMLSPIIWENTPYAAFICGDCPHTAHVMSVQFLLW